MATAWKTTVHESGSWKTVYFRCPECGGTFPDLVKPHDQTTWADRCKLCKAWMSSDEPPAQVAVPTAPRIRKNNRVKAVDQTYRQMEEQSIRRANDAASMLEGAYAEAGKADPIEGNPALVQDFQKSQIADMRSSLKVTDMKDPESLRPGDSSYIPQGRVLPSAALPGANFGNLPRDYAAGEGVSPELGAVMSQIRSGHSQAARSVMAAGNMGVHKR